MKANAGTRIEREAGGLRPLTPADAEAIQRLAADERVARFTAHVPHPYPDGAAARFIGEAAEQARRGEGRVFAIADGAGTLIGCAGFRVDADGAVHLGYWLGVPWWGAGIMTKALARLIREARRAFPGRDLAALVSTRNRASARVLEKNGFEARGAAICRAPARGADMAATRVAGGAR